jgi:hypothetical protein
MKFFPAFLIVLAVAVSCKNKAVQPGEDTTAKDSTAAADSAASTFIPVADIIRSDLKQIDSFAGGILKKTTINGKQDSAFIKPAQLRQAAQAFLIPELEPDNFRQSFQENSFMDETTGLLQFMYTPKDQSTSSIRSLIAYVSTGSTGNSINRIYLEREWSAGDTLVQQKLTWRLRQYFYIITIRQPQKGATSTSIEKLIWDPEQFGE